MTSLSIGGVGTRLERAFRRALFNQVERDHGEPDEKFQRRRIVVVLVLVVGAVLLGLSLSVRPGDSSFYLLTFLLALTWAVGGFVSGPLHLGYIPFRGAMRRPILTGIGVGLASAAVFIAGALLVRQVPPLRDYVENVLAHARFGSVVLVTLVTVLNGVAEEIFFRGALYAGIGRRHAVPISTLIYAAATVATRNPMLVFAAMTLGFVLALQRRASGGILGGILTHVTWSLVMLFALPPLFI